MVLVTGKILNLPPWARSLNGTQLLIALEPSLHKDSQSLKDARKAQRACQGNNQIFFHPLLREVSEIPFKIFDGELKMERECRLVLLFTNNDYPAVHDFNLQQQVNSIISYSFYVLLYYCSDEH